MDEFGRVNETAARPGRAAEPVVADAARKVLARCHYMIHGISDGVRPLCDVRSKASHDEATPFHRPTEDGDIDP